MNKKTHLIITLLVSFLLLNSNALSANTTEANGERSLVEIFDDFADTYKVFFSYEKANIEDCLLYTSPSPRDQRGSRMPSSA